MWFWRAWRSSAATTRAAAPSVIRLRRTTKPIQSSAVDGTCSAAHFPACAARDRYRYLLVGGSAVSLFLFTVLGSVLGARLQLLSHSCRAKELLMLMSTMHHEFRMRVNLPPFADDLLFPHLPLFNTAPAGSTNFSLVFVFARVWCSATRAPIPIFFAWRSLSRTPV